MRMATATTIAATVDDERRLKVATATFEVAAAASGGQLTAADAASARANQNLTTSFQRCKIATLSLCNVFFTVVTIVAAGRPPPHAASQQQQKRESFALRGPPLRFVAHARE